jgi:phospho-N-acetylmuramoyl-pentapeptide-transferase
VVSFSDQIGPLNVFRYITFRTGGAIMTALLFVFLFGPAIIDLLRVKQGKGSPSARTGRPRTSPRRARRPWAGS